MFPSPVEEETNTPAYLKPGSPELRENPSWSLVSCPLVFEGHGHRNLIVTWRIIYKLRMVAFLPVGTAGGYTGNTSTSRMMWTKDACVFPTGQLLNLWSWVERVIIPKMLCVRKVNLQQLPCAKAEASKGTGPGQVHLSLPAPFLSTLLQCQSVQEL